MIYTVQNSGGEVYGAFPLPPESQLSSQEWADQLHERLHDIEGINGIKAGTLVMDSATGREVDRVAIDIEPWEHKRRYSRLAERERLERVHQTVGMIASGEEFELPVESHRNRVGGLLARVFRHSH